MSGVAVTLPDGYGYVILGCIMAPTLANFKLMGPVMKARKQYNIPYPNLYAVPGHHDKADAFNRVQRGHQNFLEGIGDYRFMALIGGLKYPYLNAVGGLVFSIGSVLYQVGYSDLNLDVKMARYKKGAGIKWIGFIIAFGSCISYAGTLLNYW